LTAVNGGRRECRELPGTIHHWITSSTYSSNACGMVRPSAFAVFMLITSSNFVVNVGDEWLLYGVMLERPLVAVLRSRWDKRGRGGTTMS
jgi:hypothetical protein